MEQRKICIVGIGFKGMVLAMTFGKNHVVWGYDHNPKRVAELKEGKDNFHQYDSEELETSHLVITDQLHDVKHCNFYIIQVPAGLKAGNQPDLGVLQAACKDVGKLLQLGDILVIETTVYPGVTEEICLPILEAQSGLLAEIDFHLGYSPERMDITDPQHDLTKTPKLVACSDNDALEIITTVYESIIPAGVIPSHSIKVTEAAKLFENVQKDLNIGLANEFAMIMDKINLDPLEVLDLACTKWDVMPFKPGLVGGQHTVVSPYYLAFLAESLGQHPLLFQEGRKLNDSMPEYIAKKALQLTAHLGKGLFGEVATILGLSYKSNIADLRGSRVIDLCTELKSFGMDLQLIDPIVETSQVVTHFGKSSTEITEAKPASLVIFAVNHKELSDLPQDFLLDLLEKKACFIDLTGTIDLEAFTKKGHTTWRF